MFPVIYDAPTVIIFENKCPDLVLNQEAFDLWSNAFPLGCLDMWIHHLSLYGSDMIIMILKFIL